MHRQSKPGSGLPLSPSRVTIDGLSVDYRCIRCGGAGYWDGDGEWACIMCGRVLARPHPQTFEYGSPSEVMADNNHSPDLLPRRNGPLSGYSDGVLTLNFSTHEARYRGKVVTLRPIEFRLLSFLCRHNGVVPHERLLEGVWDTEHGSQDSLKWHIRSLREKLEEDPGRPQMIVTVRGEGYQYIPSEPATLGPSHARR